MVRTPYFRSHYPAESRKIDQGYQDMGKAIIDLIKKILHRCNPLRTPQKYRGYKIDTMTPGILVLAFVVVTLYVLAIES